MHKVIRDEIARRQEIVDSKTAKFTKAEELRAEADKIANELRAEADKLETEANAIDVDTLVAEIEELKGYLPKEEDEVESTEETSTEA